MILLVSFIILCVLIILSYSIIALYHVWVEKMICIVPYVFESDLYVFVILKLQSSVNVMWSELQMVISLVLLDLEYQFWVISVVS